MRGILALVVAGGLSLGVDRTAHAQVTVGVSPWGGFGLSVGNPYGMYSSGYYGLGNYGYGGYGLGGYSYLPSTTVYSSGYYGVTPGYGYSTYAYPSVYSYRSYYPAYGYGGYYGGFRPYRRYGRIGGFW